MLFEPSVTAPSVATSKLNNVDYTLAIWISILIVFVKDFSTCQYKWLKVTGGEQAHQKGDFPLARGKTTQLAERADCYSAACTNTGSKYGRVIEWEERHENALLTLNLRHCIA